MDGRSVARREWAGDRRT